MPDTTPTVSTSGTSGEHRNGREAMDRLTQRLVESGVSPATAEEKARETARRMDRKGYGEREGGRR